MPTRRSMLLGMAAAATFAATGCGRSNDAVAPTATSAGTQRPPAPSTPAPYFPPAAGTWETVAPLAAGWDPDRLAAAVDFAGQSAASLMILNAGRIVAEHYWAGTSASTLREVASVQKSVTSALVANTASAGRLAIDDTIGIYVGAGWSLATANAENAITVRHLLSMSSGLDEQLRYVAAPGTRWFYNTPAYHVLHPVLENATGTSLADWCARTLFNPIGITNATWDLHQSGGRSGYGLRMTARDMARVGLLILADGNWQTTQVLPSDYARWAMRPSQADNRSYGMLWWLNSARRKNIPPAPNDLVSAQGARGQRIYVVPSMSTVVVRQSDSQSEDNRMDEQLWDALMGARS